MVNSKTYAGTSNDALKISVITPTHNRADVLPRALESVKQQTFESYEHIVIDDGSTDNTEQVVEEYAHGRLRYLPLEQNQGVATALNLGVDAAIGEYIAVLDSDDQYLPERLDVTNRVLDSQSPDVGGVFHAYYRIEDQTGSETTFSVPEGRVTERDLAAENLIVGNSNTMYRSSVFEQIGRFDEKFDSSSDFDFQLRLAQQFDWIGINEPLMKKDYSIEGIQKNPAKIRQGEERLLKKHADVLTEEHAAERHWTAAMQCVKIGDEQSAETHIQESAKLNPTENHAGLHFGAGIGYLKFDYKQKARSHFIKSLRLGGPDPKLLILLSVTILPLRGGTSWNALKYARDALFPKNGSLADSFLT